jgi:hypothetical protein
VQQLAGIGVLDHKPDGAGAQRLDPVGAGDGGVDADVPDDEAGGVSAGLQ